MMLLIIIMLLAIWIVTDFMDNTAETPEDRSKNSVKKTKAIVLIVLFTVIAGILLLIIGFYASFDFLLDSCCDTARGIGEIG
ncbi:hypothetical protein [Ruminococcus flavefaciens]|uniref:hypothetical protein n=1 Tax=Ruminococcus flavefaciens TaxID=1265 RepID=UPI0026EC1561|nr:hypothetical protein [Ruminococcus flavefaciens]